MARIEGIVVNSTGQATDNVQITLTDPAAPTAGAVSMAARADAKAASASPTCRPAATA